MNQQFLRYYLPALALGMLGTVFKLSLARDFLLLHLWMGILLIIFLLFLQAWKWHTTTDKASFLAKLPALVIFYGSSLGILLFCLVLVV